MSISPAEFGAIVVHTASNCIGLIANGLLLYLVLARTPKNIQAYSILMFNFALTDFCGCLTAIFVQQRYSFFNKSPEFLNYRIIPIGFSLAYISSGPCKYFGSLVCYVRQAEQLLLKKFPFQLFCNAPLLCAHSLESAPLLHVPLPRPETSQSHKENDYFCSFELLLHLLLPIRKLSPFFSSK